MGDGRGRARAADRGLRQPSWRSSGGWLAGEATLRITAASTSVRAFEQPLRHAAAVARAMLVGAAADRWNVEPHGMRDRRRLRAQRRRGPSPSASLPRKPPTAAPPQQSAAPAGGKGRADRPAAAAARRPGEGRRKLALCRGRAAAGDAVRIGRACAARRPATRLFARCDRGHAGRAPCRRARRLDRGGRGQLVGGRARGQGRRAGLYRRAHAGGHRGRCSRTRWPNGDAETWFSRGDYDSDVRAARARLPPLIMPRRRQHLGLEPLAATARFDGRRLEVWAPTQAPGLRAKRAEQPRTARPSHALSDAGGRARGTGARGRRHPHGGRARARSSGRPVQVSLSQSASQNHDRASRGRARADDGAAGRRRITAAWKMAFAAADGLGSALGARSAGRGRAAELGKPRSRRCRPIRSPTSRIEASDAEPALRGRLHARLAAARVRLLHRELHRRAGACRGHGAARVPHVDARRQRPARALPAGRGAARAMGRRRRREHDGPCRRSAFGSHIGLVATASIGERSEGEGPSAGRRRRLRPRRQQRHRRAADRGGTDLGARPGHRPRRPNGSPECRARGRSAGSACRGLATSRRSCVEIIPSSEAPGGVSGLGTTVARARGRQRDLCRLPASACARCRSILWQRDEPPSGPSRPCPSRRSACC